MTQRPKNFNPRSPYSHPEDYIISPSEGVLSATVRNALLMGLHTMNYSYYADMSPAEAFSRIAIAMGMTPDDIGREAGQIGGKILTGKDVLELIALIPETKEAATEHGARLAHLLLPHVERALDERRITYYQFERLYDSDAPVVANSVWGLADAVQQRVVRRGNTSVAADRVAGRNVFELPEVQAPALTPEKPAPDPAVQAAIERVRALSVGREFNTSLRTPRKRTASKETQNSDSDKAEALTTDTPKPARKRVAKISQQRDVAPERLVEPEEIDIPPISAEDFAAPEPVAEPNGAEVVAAALAKEAKLNQAIDLSEAEKNGWLDPETGQPYAADQIIHTVIQELPKTIHHENGVDALGHLFKMAQIPKLAQSGLLRLCQPLAATTDIEPACIFKMAMAIRPYITGEKKWGPGSIRDVSSQLNERAR